MSLDDLTPVFHEDGGTGNFNFIGGTKNVIGVGVVQTDGGIFGSAISFNGINGYYYYDQENLPAPPSPQRAITVAGWFKTNSFTKGEAPHPKGCSFLRNPPLRSGVGHLGNQSRYKPQMTDNYVKNSLNVFEFLIAVENQKMKDSRSLLILIVLCSARKNVSLHPCWKFIPTLKVCPSGKSAFGGVGYSKKIKMK